MDNYGKVTFVERDASHRILCKGNKSLKVPRCYCRFLVTKVNGIYVRNHFSHVQSVECSHNKLFILLHVYFSLSYP